jgi:acylphosphatase
VSSEQQFNPIRRHVIYHGRVQGVCFRMISHELSHNFQVVGYVRNLPNGTVEVEAEGEPAEVDRFLAAIATEFKQNISNADIRALPPAGAEGAFRITYWRRRNRHWGRS